MATKAPDCEKIVERFIREHQPPELVALMDEWQKAGNLKRFIMEFSVGFAASEMQSRLS